MNGDRLSAAEKGKQKAANDGDLPPALLLESSAGEPRRPAGDAALDSQLRKLEEAKRRGEGVGEPEREFASAEAETVSGMRDTMLAVALRFQALLELRALEEYSEPVVPVPRRNNHKRKAEEIQALELFSKPMVPVPQLNNHKRKAEEMQAWGEFWKPVLVPQRHNRKVCLANSNISRDSDGSTSGSSS